MNAEAMNAEADEYISRLHDENSQLRDEIEELKAELAKCNADYLAVQQTATDLYIERAIQKKDALMSLKVSKENKSM